MIKELEKIVDRFLGTIVISIKKRKTDIFANNATGCVVMEIIKDEYIVEILEEKVDTYSIRY